VCSVTAGQEIAEKVHEQKNKNTSMPGKKWDCDDGKLHQHQPKSYVSTCRTKVQKLHLKN
jgi:hypothetical protein